MKTAARLAAIGALFLICAVLAQAQLVMGQYEDEASFRTWNAVGLTGAAALGLAGTQFTVAMDATSGTANPALLARLPRLSLAVNGSYTSAEFYRYALVNTGVVYSQTNVPHGLYALESAAVSGRLGPWAVGIAYGLQETYDRPPVDIYDSGYQLQFSQSGALRVLNLSVARSFGDRVSIGVGFNLLSGDLARSTKDDWGGGLEMITSDITQSWTGFFINGGLLFSVSNSFQVALVARAPYTKKADSRSMLSHQAMGGTDIVIEGSMEDEYRLPLMAGLGLSYEIIPDWRVACDLTYFNWSKYKAAYFGEPQWRDFRDILMASLGTEYSVHFTLFGQESHASIRAGLALDPQPMQEPKSSYFLYSLGTGLHWKYVFLDIGAMAGKESGSGRDLATKRLILTLGATL
jgi:long-subunit fatty acid transport protein